MEDVLLIIAVVLLVVLLIAVAVGLYLLSRRGGGDSQQLQLQQSAVMQQLGVLRDAMEQSRQLTQQQIADSRQGFDQRIGELARHVNQRMTEVNTSLQHQLTDSRKTLQQELAENRQQVGQSTKVMLERLENSGKLFSQITEQFGQLQESSKRLADLGADVSKLHQILAPSMGRGQFGEHLLEEMLRNVLPAGSYIMQHPFKDGCRVDAMVNLAHGKVCIDSKFPLPAYQQFVAADPRDNADERKTAYRNFIRDCRRHIDAIASKYIRPDEGTLDFALMYIPAESVYYETIITHEDLAANEPIAQYAMAKRVVCVSPNTLLAYLHVILIGLKGLQVEQNARNILGGLSRIGDELTRFGDDFRLIGRHLDNARSKFTDAEKRLDKVNTRIEQVAQLGGAEGDGDADTDTDPLQLEQPSAT